MTMDPDWTAQLDQAVAGVRDFAKAVAAFHGSLVAEGCDAETATALTMAYLTAMISTHAAQPSPDESA